MKLVEVKFMRGPNDLADAEKKMKALGKKGAFKGTPAQSKKPEARVGNCGYTYKTGIPVQRRAETKYVDLGKGVVGVKQAQKPVKAKREPKAKTPKGTYPRGRPPKTGRRTKAQIAAQNARDAAFVATLV